MDNIIDFFEDRYVFLRKLKQQTYEENTRAFEEKFGSILDDMLTRSADEADKISREFASGVFEHFAKKGKIKGDVLMDLNFCMVYYVFPYLLKNKDKGGEEFAAVLKDKWNETMGSNISYTTYEDLYSGFKKKLFGFF